MNDLRKLDRVQIAVWFSYKSNRWIAHCPAANVTAHGPKQLLAIEALRGELVSEELALDDFPPAGNGEPPPEGADWIFIARRADRKWA